MRPSTIEVGSKIIAGRDVTIARNDQVTSANDSVIAKRDQPIETNDVNQRKRGLMFKDHPTRTHYEKLAKAKIRKELREQGLSYKQLSHLLGRKGVRVTARSLTNQISKGGFSAAFLLLCLDVIAALPSASEEPTRR